MPAFEEWLDSAQLPYIIAASISQKPIREAGWIAELVASQARSVENLQTGGRLFLRAMHTTTSLSD